MISIRRGEIWWVDFSASIAGEIKKTRPAVIISNNYSNELLNRVQIIPLTSKVDKCYPCESYVLIDGKKSKAMADQIMTVSKERLRSKITTASDDDIKAIERAIKIQLSLIF